MKRSKFSLSHYKLLTCDMGELVPIAWFEALPGDTVQQLTSMLVRVSPLISPVMHPVEMRVHHWFVPNRLIWEDWESFITGGPDGMDASAHPRLSGPTVSSGSLLDYLGLPPGASPLPPVSALPLRAYQLIWSEWYRDQDLQAEPVLSVASGDDLTTDRVLKKVAWEKDYFTSARPWTQKGPSVTVPMGVAAPVVPTGNGQPRFNVNPGLSDSTLNSSSGSAQVNWDSAATATGAASWHITALEADLTNAEAANINELRTAFALQRYAEARARYGSRYTEYLRYLGVRSSDARLQRPEYLGGGKQTLQFSEVLQTGPDDVTNGQIVGGLKGHGIGAMRSNRYRRFFEEHGIVMSLLSVRPRTMYGQALHRSFLRTTKEDYFQKELQHVGQQEVWNKEVYAHHSTPDGVFGYQDRYDEYRRAESGLAGDFRSTLDYWHYARLFAADPALNASFIACDATKRVNAVQTDDVLWIMANHSIQARRLVAGSARSFIL